MQVDILKELRLRRWARENYVPPAARDISWHPIVLEEMQRRDEELLASLVRDEQRTSAPGQRLAPLMPDANRRLDAAHEEVPSPSFLREAVRSSQEIGMYYQ